jgi:hypothetical protein
MRNDVLADRLTNYADALVAAAFIFMTGIGAAVGDPDVRCELADATPKMLFVVCFGGLGIFLALRWLNKWNKVLREVTQDTEDTSNVLKKLSIVRFSLVIVFILAAGIFVLLSLTDNSCLSMVPGDA